MIYLSGEGKLPQSPNLQGGHTATCHTAWGGDERGSCRKVLSAHPVTAPAAAKWGEIQSGHWTLEPHLGCEMAQGGQEYVGLAIAEPIPLAGQS